MCEEREELAAWQLKLNAELETIRTEQHRLEGELLTEAKKNG